MWCRVWPTNRSTHLGTNLVQGTPLLGAFDHSLLMQSNTRRTDGNLSWLPSCLHRSWTLETVAVSCTHKSVTGRRLVSK